MSKLSKKIPKTYRLSNETIGIINELAEISGKDATAIIEEAIAHYHEPGKKIAIEKMKLKLQELENIK